MCAMAEVELEEEEEEEEEEAAAAGGAMTHATPRSALHGKPAALMAVGQQFCLVVASPRLVPSHTSGVSAHESRLCPQPRVQQALAVSSSRPEGGP